MTAGSDPEIDELLEQIRRRAKAKGPRRIHFLQNYIDELEREVAERLRVNRGLMRENEALKKHPGKPKP
jgi:hypothetical protein